MTLAFLGWSFILTLWLMLSPACLSWCNHDQLFPLKGAVLSCKRVSLWLLDGTNEPQCTSWNSDILACSLSFFIGGTIEQQQQSLLRPHYAVKDQHFWSLQFNKAEFFPHYVLLIEIIVAGSSEDKKKRFCWKQSRNIFFNNVNLTSARVPHGASWSALCRG